ncbi:SH3 domain-containing protein [Leptothoe sp. ISB3NOV94-8A]
MNFKNEDHLQEFIHSVTGGAREVEMPDGSRVDVLTSGAVIEVKPKLTRSALLQAMAQAQIYGSHHPGKRMVIAGCTPSNEEASYTTADRVRSQGVEVWYVDQMREFQEAWDDLHEAEYEEEPSFDWHRPLADLFNSDPQDDGDGDSGWIAILMIGALLLFLIGLNRRPVAPVSPASSSAIPMFSAGEYGSAVVGRIPEGAAVSILKCEDDFVQVSYQGREGWVRDFEVSGCR